MSVQVYGQNQKIVNNLDQQMRLIHGKYKLLYATAQEQHAKIKYNEQFKYLAKGHDYEQIK